MNTPYETIFLLPPNKATEDIDAFIGRLQEAIEKKRGEVTAIEKMGVRKTAYLVNKQTSAYYIMIQYRGTGETIHEVERTLKNSDEVLKYLSTKVTTKTSARLTAKAQAKALKSKKSADKPQTADTSSASATPNADPVNLPAQE